MSRRRARPRPGGLGWWATPGLAHDTATLEAAAPSSSTAGRLTPAVATGYDASSTFGPYSRWGTGRDALAPVDFPWPTEGAWYLSRDVAMTVPTISRARDLICSAIGSLPLTLWFRDPPPPDGSPPGMTLRAPYPWQDRPDPARTRNWLLSWTADDLLFHGRAYWHVTDRYSSGYPSAFERLPFADVSVDQAGEVVRWANQAIPVADVVEFLSPIQGLLSNGGRAISIAVRLDTAADRFAGAEVPAGWLKQTGGEDITGTELAEMAAGFTVARRTNTTAALNQWVDYHEATYDPQKLQLMDSRQHQALELARLANVPPFLVGAPAGTGMTYQNAEQARRDLIDFGALPYINCIEQTLSGPNVTPRGQLITLDTQAWLRSPFTTSTPAPSEPPPPMSPAPPPESLTEPEVPAP